MKRAMQVQKAYIYDKNALDRGDLKMQKSTTDRFFLWK